MRETGPVSKTLTGDEEASVGQVSQARTQLGILKNQMKLGNLSFGKRQVQFEDGTVVTALSMNGQDFVSISTVPAVEPELPPDIPEPEIPEVPVDHPWQYAWICGDAPDVGPGTFLPITIDGDTYTEASYRPYAAGVRHTINQGGKWILFGAVDIETGIPMDMSYQPKTLTISSDQADQGVVEYTAEEAIHILPTTSRPMAVIGLPPASAAQDTLVTLHVGGSNFEILIPMNTDVDVTADLLNNAVGTLPLVISGSTSSGAITIGYPGNIESPWTIVSSSAPYSPTEDRPNLVSVVGFNGFQDVNFPGAVAAHANWGDYIVTASGGTLGIEFTGMYATVVAGGIPGRTATYSASGSVTGVVTDTSGNSTYHPFTLTVTLTFHTVGLTP